MLHIVLFEPEIPPNTGNIMRLAANMNARLHLIKPLGFDIDNKQLRRAGMDYREIANVSVYDDFSDFIDKINPERLFACSTKGKKNYAEVDYQDGDAFLFGPETRGLPDDILNTFSVDKLIRIPMVAESRSLNLANSVSVILYEAWRQLDFSGCV